MVQTSVGMVIILLSMTIHNKPMRQIYRFVMPSCDWNWCAWITWSIPMASLLRESLERHDCLDIKKWNKILSTAGSPSSWNWKSKTMLLWCTTQNFINWCRCIFYIFISNRFLISICHFNLISIYWIPLYITQNMLKQNKEKFMSETKALK